MLDELRPLEEKYADVLDIVGVHSPKFEHERDPVALAAAVERYGVAHPVLDDPDLVTWDQYAAKAWPTLSVVDPEGYVVASMAGEGHAEGLARLVDELVAIHTAKGTLRRGDGAYVPPPAAETALRFPARHVVRRPARCWWRTRPITAWPRWTVATVVRRIGSGQRGRADGPAAMASFSEPNGLCLLPPRWPRRVGYDLVVADTVNHLLRGRRPGHRRRVHCGRYRSPVARHGGLRRPRRPRRSTCPRRGTWRGTRAGSSSRWPASTSCGGSIPVPGPAGVYAGTTVEALRDGALDQVWMAQPSGLSVSADGATLWIADSESSALRYVRDGEMHTVVGPGPVRLRPHGRPGGPGVAAASARGCARCPTGRCSSPTPTTARYGGTTPPPARCPQWPRAWPSRATWSALPDGGLHGGRVGRPPPDRAAATWPTADVPGAGYRTERPPTTVAPGEVALDVIFTPAPGQKLDESFGPSTRLQVSASPPELLVSGEGTTTDLRRTLVIASNVDGWRAAGRGAGGHLRRRGRAPGLPPHPAGLGRADRGVTPRARAGCR